MTDMSVPIVLAFAGTALMAVAIFVPFRSRAAAGDGEEDEAVEVPDGPSWPELVEPSATGCDVVARLDLVDALASIGSPWALGVLYRAREEETDPIVQAAIRLALERVAGPATVG